MSIHRLLFSIIILLSISMPMSIEAANPCLQKTSKTLRSFIRLLRRQTVEIQEKSEKHEYSEVRQNVLVITLPRLNNLPNRRGQLSPETYFGEAYSTIIAPNNEAQLREVLIAVSKQLLTAQADHRLLKLIDKAIQTIQMRNSVEIRPDPLSFIRTVVIKINRTKDKQHVLITGSRENGTSIDLAQAEFVKTLGRHNAFIYPYNRRIEQKLNLSESAIINAVAKIFESLNITLEESEILQIQEFIHSKKDLSLRIEIPRMGIAIYLDSNYALSSLAATIEPMTTVKIPATQETLDNVARTIRTALALSKNPT